MSVFVEVKYATRRDLDDICQSVNMLANELKLMHQWYAQSSEVWAGFYKGQIACMYGVYSTTLLSETAYLWLVTNDLVREHPFLFVRHSQMVVKELLRTYGTIVGHVNSRHINSMQWLEWLGMKLQRHEIKNDLIPFKLKRSG